MPGPKYVELLKEKLKLHVHVNSCTIFMQNATKDCGDKIFRKSPLHQDMEPLDHPAKQMKVSSRMVCSTKCYTDCACKGFFYRYDGTCSLFSTRFHALQFDNADGSHGFEYTGSIPSNCSDAMLTGCGTDGVYSLKPRDYDQPINVPCQMASGESWLVIQRRTDGSEDFYRTWNEYRDGFGDLNNEFWLGNNNIHRITSHGQYELSVNLEDFDGNTRYALYKNFSVSSEEDFFRLSIGEYSGNAGNGLLIHNGFGFSTRDADLDASVLVNCALNFQGAWWFKSCCTSHLNGKYLPEPESGILDGIKWDAWRGPNYSLKRTEMKIKPMK